MHEAHLQQRSSRAHPTVMGRQCPLWFYTEGGFFCNAGELQRQDLKSFELMSYTLVPPDMCLHSGWEWLSHHHKHSTGGPSRASTQGRAWAMVRRPRGKSKGGTMGLHPLHGFCRFVHHRSHRWRLITRNTCRATGFSGRWEAGGCHQLLSCGSCSSVFQVIKKPCRPVSWGMLSTFRRSPCEERGSTGLSQHKLGEVIPSHQRHSALQQCLAAFLKVASSH